MEIRILTEVPVAGSWYNGYSEKERELKFKEQKLRIAAREIASCGDPEVPVEYHDEDYSQPYLWEPPALLALCRPCHRDKLHNRFFCGERRGARLWHTCGAVDTPGI